MSTGQLRIISLESSNIKRIKTVAIAPTSNVVRIHGENGSGKTSTLDSILWALGGAGNIAMVPVRDNEERGVITLTLGEGQKVEYIVTRTFRRSEDGTYTTKLTVESAVGALYPKAQTKLNELFGELSLDPLEFLRMSPKDRVNALKAIVQVDIDLDELDRMNAGDFEKRSQVNIEVKALKNRVELYAGGVDMAMTVEPIDTAGLMQQINEASEHNAVNERAKSAIERSIAEAILMEKQATDNRAQAERLLRAADKLEADAKEQREFAQQQMAGISALVDVSDLTRQVQDAQRENATRSIQRTARANYEAAKDELVVAVARANMLTEQMEYRTTRKQEALAKAKFPVPGLTFSEQGVSFNGFPFDQASGAEQLRVSFAIAAAMKPKLPVVLIKDGSLLSDTQGMPLLEELAAEYGAQVWIERVGSGAVGFVLEEGEVVAVDGVPVPPKVEAGS